MSILEFSIIASMFALPAAAIIIIAVCVYQDIQSKKEMKRFETAVHECESIQGWEFTSRLLARCSNSQLPVIHRIELLEHFAGKKDIHVAINERMAKN